METTIETIRDQQRDTWNKFSVGWKKWDELVLAWLRPINSALLDAARLTETSHVLDVASGTGEPALTEALACRRGRVTMTDLAEDMLRVAEDTARRRGLANVESRRCDAGDLPFADQSFDAVTGRFGFMFFPDVHRTARELVRVARPGARVVTTVWAAPDKNPWATTIMGTIAEHVELPQPAPGAPGLFRCAAPGYMSDVFAGAGLRDVSEKELSVPLEFDDPAQYFTFMGEVAAPVVAGMARADEPTRARIREKVLRLVAERSSGGKVRFAGTAILVVGEKPRA